MLVILYSALLGAPNVAIVTSTLRSVYGLVQYHCPQLLLANKEDTETTPKNKTTETEDSIEHFDPVLDPAEGNDYFIASNQVITFLRPIVETIHARAIQQDVLFPQCRHMVSCHGTIVDYVWILTCMSGDKLSSIHVCLY